MKRTNISIKGNVQMAGFRTFIVIILIIVSIVVASTLSLRAADASADAKKVIICFKTNTTPSIQQEITTKYDCKLLERNDALNCILVQVNREDTQQFINRVSKEDLVKYAEPNKLVHALYTPDDPYYSEQWGLKHINVDSAWDIEKGNKNVTIAVIDTGIDYTHEDLVNNYVTGGYDWVNDDSDPMDDHGHGTFCAGIIAATINNEKGIAGIAQVNIMAEKVLNETGYGTDWEVARGITHATDNNVSILSMSLGGDDAAQILEDACLYAWNNGCLLVAASGNDGKQGVSYPAAYETVIAVGAIDQNDQRCGFSNWGPDLELVAPGVGILSTYPHNQYVQKDGTSMAAPHVAGVAALVWSKYPFLTNHELRDRLAQTAYDLGAVGFDEYFGYGRVDALNATITINLPPAVTVLYPNGGEEVNGTVTINATASDPDGTVVNVEFQYSPDNGTSWKSIVNVTPPLLGNCTYEWDTTTVPNGAEYLIKAIATDDTGATASDVSNTSFVIANKLSVHAPNMSIVNQTLAVTVTYNTYPGPPVDNATVFFEIGGAQFMRTTNTTGIATFTPQTTGLLNITAHKTGYTDSDMVQVHVLPAYNVSLTADHYALTTIEGRNATYTLRVKNTGYFLDNYTLTIANPDGADTAALKENVTKIDDMRYKTVDVSSGDSIIVLLDVTDSGAGIFHVNVTANSTGDSTKVDFVNTTTTVEDITAPGITFVAPTPEDNAMLNTSYVTINVTLNETGSIAYLNWNGVNETMNGSGTNFYLNKTGLADAQYTYKVYANDTAGNMGESETRVVIIDTTPPSGVSNLTESALGTTWINWTWDNPEDLISGFNYTEIQIWEAGSLDKEGTTSNEFYNATGLKSNTTYEIRLRTVDRAGNVNLTWIADTAKTLLLPITFDTGHPQNPYPSIPGIHNGTIKPSQNITVRKLYTYPCAGTGGHTEYARIWRDSVLDVNATWEGYKGDWHNITFNEPFVLYKNKTYNYTIITGSYPQIIHNRNHTTLDGSFINCTEFVDANGNKYNDWIPAFKLFL